MNTAMEISLATGKPLGTVVEALAKANDGNTAALKKLGITQGEATRNYGEYAKAVKDVEKKEGEAAAAREEYGPKSKEYAKAQERVKVALDKLNAIKGQGGIKWVKELNQQFEGSIAADADTYAGSMRRVSAAFDELLEAFGAGALSQGGGVNGEMDDLASTMYDMQPDAENLGRLFADLAISAATFATYIGPIAEQLNNINDMGNGLITNGSLVTFLKAINGDVSLPGVVTGGSAPGDMTPAQIAGKWDTSRNNPDTWGSFYTGGNAYRPMRTAQRNRDAAGTSSARAAQAEARTRQRP
jgi:hypothetical protein